MSKTYAEVAKQIEVLKRDAEKLRRKEVVGVISRIRQAIVAYDLTAADLGFGPSGRIKAEPKAAPAKKAKGAKTAKAPKAAKAPAVVKYRNEDGATWGGRGKRPQWLRDALAAGKQLSDFEVK